MLRLCWEEEEEEGRKVVPSPLSPAAAGEAHPPGGSPKTAPKAKGGHGAGRVQ